MIRIVLTAIRAHFRSGLLLLALTVFGVALGVGSVVSIQLINRSAVASFEAGVDAIYGEVDLSIVARGPAFADELYPRALATPGVARAWPRIDLLVRVAGDGPRPFLELKGVDLARPGDLPIDTAADVRGSPFSDQAFVAISRPLAEQLGLGLGDPLPVSSGSRAATLHVGAWFDLSRTSSLASPRVAVMDIASAQETFDRIGELDAIDVRVAPGSDLREVSRRLQDALGATVEVLTPGDQEQRARGLLAAFRVNLTALSLISLFVGAFLVFASVQASLIRRRREFGILRTLGATPRQVLCVILIEVALIGSLGTLLGLPLGIHAARANLDAVSTAITYVYLLKEVDRLVIPAFLPWLAALVGVLGSLLGAIGPALHICRSHPLALLSSLNIHEALHRMTWRLAALGALLSIAALCWYAALGIDSRSAGFVLGSALMLTIPLLSPLCLQLAARIAPARGFGLGYAMRSLGRRLQSGAAAVASLAVAASMLFGVTTMVSSFRSTVDDWIGATVRADLYIATATWPRGGDDARLDPAIIDALRADPQVTTIDRLRKIVTFVGDQRVTLTGVDFDLPDDVRHYPLLDGDDAQALAAVREHDAVLLGEPVARHLGLWTGDVLEIGAIDGPIALPIAGVYYDYSSATGNVVIARATLNRLFGGDVVHTVALYLQPGADADAAADRLRHQFGDLPLTFTTNERIRREALRIFDQTFLVTGLLQLISLAIAACGIALTLLVQARELAAETALYRAIGGQRGQVFRLFVAKGLAIGAIGLGLGAVGGAALYWILSHVINRAWFGWTILPSLPLAALLQQMVVIGAAVIAASLYPAAVASRTPATELAREDA